MDIELIRQKKERIEKELRVLEINVQRLSGAIAIMNEMIKEEEATKGNKVDGI